MRSLAVITASVIGHWSLCHSLVIGHWVIGHFSPRPMIKKTVSFALHQPLFLIMMAMLFVAGGIVAFKSLPIEAFPDVSDIQVAVITLFPGHAPEEVEKQVTIPLEIA